MKRGAFAMMNALGFNEIWKREKEGAVIEKLKELVALSTRNVATLHDREREIPDEAIGTVTSSITSGTLAIGLTTKSNDHVKAIVSLLPAEGQPAELTQGVIDRVALAILASVVRDVLVRAATTLPYLTLRGCLAFGHFEMDASVAMGRAVDEAAENLDVAQGAMVWLAPSASAIADGFPLHLTEDPIVPYSVPMRGGQEYRTYAVAPFSIEDADTDRARIMQRMLQSFTPGPIDVEMKKQHTEKFLRTASSEFQKRRETSF